MTYSDTSKRRGAPVSVLLGAAFAGFAFGGGFDDVNYQAVFNSGETLFSVESKSVVGSPDIVARATDIYTNQEVRVTVVDPITLKPVGERYEQGWGISNTHPV